MKLPYKDLVIYLFLNEFSLNAHKLRNLEAN
jgi:hypothetical protein